MQTTSNDIKGHGIASAASSMRRCITGIMVSLLVGVVAAWILAVAWLAARASVTAPGPASADELLALTTATLAIVIGAWLVLGTTLEVLSHVPGRIGRIAQVWADRLTPALARRVVAFVLGVGMGVAGGPTQAVAGARSVVADSSVADPGFAPTRPAPDLPFLEPGFVPATGGHHSSPSPKRSTNPGFTPEPAGPGFTPTAPRVRPQIDPDLIGGRVSSTSESEVVVHRGDSLWSIAARHLGARASDAEIAQAWPQWFDLNRDQIGADPDLILPGQILRVPGADQTASAHR